MNYRNLPPHSTAELEKGRNKIERGYPEGRYRYRTELAPSVLAMTIKNNALFVPDDGPHHITNHPNRLKAIDRGDTIQPLITNEEPASEELRQYWHTLGLHTDTAGRALHPRAPELLPTIGMFTGPGFHYGYGPQRMVNLGLRKVEGDKVKYAVALVKRKQLQWGLPGGYAEPNETIDQGAFREGFEEAGIIRKQLGHLALRRTFAPPKGFWRDTLHAWGEEHFVFAASYTNPSLEGITLQINDPDEVLEVKWMTLEEITMLENFLGTHRKQILEAEGVANKP